MAPLATPETIRSYFDPDDAWRRVDADWLGAAEQLALTLDSDANNTSLVLAFELAEGGDVLLFPGDAQGGSWLSWSAYRWPKHAGENDPKAVTAERLLARTVLYKVGHHGSDGGTLRSGGLELMTSRELAAMLPVDEMFARDVKGWDMPFKSLLDSLIERTRGRVLRADTPVRDVWATSRERLSAKEWKAFRERSRDSAEPDLYVEYDVPIPIAHPSGLDG